jgi:TfoX/Sxy family transcriptional regulator of competence genes
MAYDEKLADRVREYLMNVSNVEEKKMMGGVAFMVKDKMCIGIVKDDLMLRIAPEEYEPALERNGCRAMDFTGKPMKGFIFVSEEGFRNARDFRYWLDLALAFNEKAKSSKRKKKGSP